MRERGGVAGGGSWLGFCWVRSKLVRQGGCTYVGDGSSFEHGEGDVVVRFEFLCKKKAKGNGSARRIIRTRSMKREK